MTAAFGERFSGMLLRFRGRTGLSQREIADRIHVHVRSVQLWEAGGSHPNARNLQGLIRLFLKNGAFTNGLEQVEAAALWSAVDEESDRLKVTFDAAWFATLLGGRPRRTGAPRASALPERRQYWGDAPDVTDFLGR
ncbi:MAG: helix-turn-helix transcriptional regulator, partial [Chloroflexi bacterium]|nr:helix-turn-helix transcriptional regulator [Chloroflexota bacterium]